MVDPIESKVLKAFGAEGYSRFIDRPHDVHDAINIRLSALGVAEHRQSPISDPDWACVVMHRLAARGIIEFTSDDVYPWTPAELTEKGLRVLATGFVHEDDYDVPLPTHDDTAAPPNFRYASLLFANSDRRPSPA